MRIYTLIISALAVVTAQAGPVDINKAKALAQKYVSSPISVETVSLAAMGKGKQAQVAEPALHMFNNENGEGFVIVSADDRVGGVLGYSDRGSLDPQNMPTPLAALLASYTRAVEAVRVDSVSVTPNYAKPPKAYVKPLVSTLWSQEYPYNYYTPRSSTSGRPTYTGCAITAAAQVLAAHKWPMQRPAAAKRGEGALGLDQYDWDNMLNDYSHGGYNETQAQAVGALMYDLGYLARATYGVNGTICDEGKVWNTLQKYYDCTVRQLEKDILPGGEFVQAIYNELSMGCPVFMTGGDHAFVYDGYDENGLIHVNWGWAGLDDGYFDINTAAVAGGGYGSDGCYYEKQLALFVHPNNGVIEPLSPKPVVLSINNDQGLQFQASEGWTTSSSIPAQLKGVGARNLAQDENGSYTGQVGIGLFAQDGTCLHVFSIMAKQTWTTYYTSYNYDYGFMAVDLSEIEGPANGTYYLRPLGRRLLNADKDEWGNWTYMINGNSVPMIVKDGKVTLVQADNKPHLSVVGMPEVFAPAYEYSSQLVGICLNIANLSRYQARGAAQVVFTGTGNIEGETYEAPVAYLTHMVAQRQDTTQWLLKFMTSYAGTTGSHALKAGKYKMSLKFNHNIETKNPATYEIAIPEDFLLEVFPSSYTGRVTVTSVNLLDEKGEPAASHYFDLTQSPTVTLGISARSANLTQGTYNAQIRYRLVNVATGATVYTSKAYKVGIPRSNSESTDLTGATRNTIDLTQLGEGTYEVHVDVERDGAWLDRWNAETFRRRFTVYTATPTQVQVTTSVAEQVQGVERMATFSAPFNAAVPEGVKAWYVKSVADNSAELTEVPEGMAIPAGEGVLLTTTSDKETFNMEKALGTMKVADLAGNLLRANDKADYTITSDDNAYVLGTMNEQTAFYRAKVGTTLGRYKAYLQWNATLPALSLDFPATTTGICKGATIDSQKPIVVYGIDGRQCAPNDARGVVIVNGKKQILIGK